MDLPPEELQHLSPVQVLRESISIPAKSPRTFSLITLSLIFPLSFAILIHFLFTHPIVHRLHTSKIHRAHEFSLLFLYEFIYLLFLFTFSLLATAAVVFTVASIYACKNTSFSSTLAAIPTVFSRLFRTFLCIALLMLAYYIAFFIAIIFILVISGDNLSDPRASTALLLIVVIIVFLAVHVVISALWHLASVITVLEPVCGFSAMKKSRELLRGKTKMALSFVFGYLSMCGLISAVFRGVVVRSGEGNHVVLSPLIKILIGGGLVVLLVGVNLVGLLLQSVFYYVCKSYHHQVIDKGALYEHLGVYLGEYVPLKSSIQMENFEL